MANKQINKCNNKMPPKDLLYPISVPCFTIISKTSHSAGGNTCRKNSQTLGKVKDLNIQN